MSVTDYSTVKFWLSRLTPRTARNNVYLFREWFNWMNENGGKFSTLSPDELIEVQQGSVGTDRYSILNFIQTFIIQLEGTYNTKKLKYSTIRSFFLHNRAELPSDRSFSIRGNKNRVYGSLTPENIREIILSSNPTYRAIFTCMLQGAFDRESFEYWNNNGWSELSKALKEGQDIIRINLPGRKHSRGINEFYTLIGPDAVKTIRDYLPFRHDDNSAIFYDQFNRPVDKTSVYYYWLRHCKKLGIIQEKKNKDPSNRYGKNPHELRDVFRTLWEKSPAIGSVAEFLMGHRVDKLGYNKAHRDVKWVIREYRKALPFLNILSSGRAFGRVEEDDVEYLKTQNEKLQIQIRQLQKQFDEITIPWLQAREIMREQFLKTMKEDELPSFLKEK